MTAEHREIEAVIRYLTPREGGRKSGVASGYRGQFYYDGRDFDGFQFFPDLPEDSYVALGALVRVNVRFAKESWDIFHATRVCIGMQFCIREGNRIVGQGVVTRV